MTLVRRDSILGRVGQQVTTTVSGAATARILGEQSDLDSARPPAFEQSAAHATVVTGPDEPASAPASEAAAVPSQHASFGAVLSAFVIIAAGGVGSWALWSNGVGGSAIQPQDTTAVFGMIIVLAAAVERVLEPFSRWLPGRHTETALEQSIAALANQSHDATKADLAAVAHAKAQVERAHGNRIVVAWGIATAGATIASTASGFYVLHAIAGAGWNGMPLWIDGVVTGVIVGSGTKPLHDIISRVQHSKEQAEAGAR
jgi:hypothetical protein